MPSPCTTSKILGEIQAMLVAELMATPTEKITLQRRDVALLQAAVGEIAGEVALLERRLAGAAQVARELAIARADIAHLELRLTIADYLASGGSPKPVVPSGSRCAFIHIDRGHRPWDPNGKGAIERAHGRSAEIVDFGEILAREHRDAGRPIGPEGGAA